MVLILLKTNVASRGHALGAQPAAEFALDRIRRMSLIAGGVLLLGSFAVWLSFDAEMRDARAALVGRSQIVQTSAGSIEYADLGTGPPLLTIHGAGGGFDQGLDNATAMIGSGYRLISPSRFGYLRTSVPADTSPAAQADALAALLDNLNIDKAIVLGVSAGTRSALELALRHPERVTALVLVVPATYYPNMVSLDSQRRADFPVILWLVNAGADFAWWALERMAPDLLIRFVGVPPEDVHGATVADREAVLGIVRRIEPLSERFAGINIDSRPDLGQRPLDQLQVPSLLISARDDLFNTYPSATYAAGQIPNAELVVFDKGGHLLVGHTAAVRTAIRQFLSVHAATSK